MEPARTHYEVLGLGTRATPDAVRAAYIDLMKRHHPNSPYRNPASLESNDVHSINLAYAVLKDVAKRAAYDAELNLGRSVALPAPQKADRRTPLVLRNKRRHRHRSSGPVIAGGVVLLMASAWVGRHDGPTSPSIAGHFSETNSAASSPFEVSPPHETTWIKRQAQLAASIGTSEAVAFSTRCFDEARQVGTPTASDECLVFDIAFAYWREGEPSAAMPAYFQPQLMQLRQARALERLDRDAALLRLDSLRAATFSSLLELANSPATLVQKQPPISEQTGTAEIGTNFAAGNAAISLDAVGE
jgi:hypothetical protein